MLDKINGLFENALKVMLQCEEPRQCTIKY